MYCVVIFVASKICDFGVTYTSKIVAEIVVISSCTYHANNFEKYISLHLERRLDLIIYTNSLHIHHTFIMYLISALLVTRCSL